MRILSVDGGGYLGLATASFLADIERHFGARCSERFELFCGTSTGAIVALALAQGMSASDVTALYEKLGPEVFPPPNWLAQRFPRLRGVFAVRHDNAPLKRALADAFGDTTLTDLRDRGKHVLITAFCVTTGKPRIFKTDHAPELTAHGGYRLRDIALASSAAPTYLPMVPLSNPSNGVREVFCDGGVVANSPALLGFAEAMSHLGRPANTLAVLSLATPRADLAERPSALSRREADPARAYFGWGMGERLITLALDSGAMISDQALKRIATALGACYERVEFAQPSGVGLDVVTPEATATLRHLGVECASRADERRRLQCFFHG